MDLSRPWHRRNAARWAVLAPLDVVGRVRQLDAWAQAARLCTESGHPVRFTCEFPGAQAGGHLDAPAYESRIFETGEVRLRIDSAGARHDLYNALAWLVWPRTKARLNALHASEIARCGAGPVRGPLRDAATLFDENAVLWVTADERLTAALRTFDWPTLFGRRRADLATSVQVEVFGHALLEKLQSPYPAITAHAWPVCLQAPVSPDALDAAVAAQLDHRTLFARAFCPLPVLGLPDWWAANEDPAFYNDPTVFRRGRRHARASGTPDLHGDNTWTSSSPAAPVSSASN